MIDLVYNNYPIIRNLTLNERRLGFAALLCMSIGTVLAHEYSHMFAASSLFLDVKQHMTCELFYCSVKYDGPLRVPEGSSIGYKLRDGIVSAAGPISDMTLVALTAVAAWKMRHTNKKISLLFATTAFTIASNTFSYALMTHGADWGDFVSVETKLGIPHYVQTAIAGAVTVGVAGLLRHLLSEKPIHTYNLRPRPTKKLI
ncbi:MAG: hypothetical protein JSS30_01970 [Verrucomicrobia bacterium]|nr:hypothetical protein [Verrucomicrobiota bacterium]